MLSQTQILDELEKDSKERVESKGSQPTERVEEAINNLSEQLSNIEEMFNKKVAEMHEIFYKPEQDEQLISPQNNNDTIDNNLENNEDII